MLIRSRKTWTPRKQCSDAGLDFLDDTGGFGRDANVLRRRGCAIPRKVRGREEHLDRLARGLDALYPDLRGDEREPLRGRRIEGGGQFRTPFELIR